MTKKFVDCFMLMGTALSLKGQSPAPLLQDVFTTVVNVSLTIEELQISNVKNMEIVLAALFTQKWVDPRLGANVRTRKMAVAGQIWKPKITNSNGIDVNTKNEDTAFWRGLGEEGNVLLSEKIRVQSSCTQNFRRFPFDSQICEFKFATYRFPIEEVSILWDLNPVEITTSLGLNEFTITNVSTIIEMDVRKSGNFSVAVVQLVLTRNSHHHINCIISPTLLLTLVNYISLWLDVKERLTRINLNFGTFFGLILFYYNSICVAQPAPYLKASDIFVAISELFAFITLLVTLYIDGICSQEEFNFNLKRRASNKEYPGSVYWLEFAVKIMYPTFYVFFLILFAVIFV